MSAPILMKPHHMVDILVQFGNGEEFVPHPYGHAVHSVAERVLSDPNLVLQMESGIDDICAPCIHNANGVCDDSIDNSWRPQAPTSKNTWNLRIDERYYAKFSLKNGDQMTVRRFAEMVSNLTIEDFNNSLYPELPPQWNSWKLKSLKKGIAKYLGQE